MALFPEESGYDASALPVPDDLICVCAAARPGIPVSGRFAAGAYPVARGATGGRGPASEESDVTVGSVRASPAFLIPRISD